MSARIKKIFEKKTKKLITFTTGGDPKLSTSKKILKTIVDNNIDLIEIGMPFSDPMADGPTIQLSSNRAIKSNITLNEIFDLAYHVRLQNNYIPIILMGYYNVIFHFGLNNFVSKCKEFKIDGLIIVDLQPEEDEELINILKENNIDLIRLVTPITNEQRLKSILTNASGFIYYVTVTGITGQNSANMEELKKSIKMIRKNSSLPIIAGFGIKNSNDVRNICKYTDGVVVGSSIVKIIEENINNENQLIENIKIFTAELKKGTIK